jgi:hypothetical protein
VHPNTTTSWLTCQLSQRLLQPPHVLQPKTLHLPLLLTLLLLLLCQHQG